MILVNSRFKLIKIFIKNFRLIIFNIYYINLAVNIKLHEQFLEIEFVFLIYINFLVIIIDLNNYISDFIIYRLKGINHPLKKLKY